jgi:hypothetical protein
MKKIVYSLFAILCSFLMAPLAADQDSRFTTALTAGYVFKNDHTFRQVYGPGIVNVITADSCYYLFEMFGLGAKLSYWRAKGKTTSLKRHTVLQEIPFTFYVRARKDVSCNLELYASLGGGGIWMKEKSYLGKTHAVKGIGEFELGSNYAVCDYCNLTSAFRCLFPSQKINHSSKRSVIGGYELRGGIAFAF